MFSKRQGLPSFNLQMKNKSSISNQPKVQLYRGILNEYQESSKSIGARSAYGNQKKSGNQIFIRQNDNT